MLIQAENIDLLTLLNPYDLSSARFGADILRQMKSALQSGDTVEYIYKYQNGEKKYSLTLKGDNLVWDPMG